MGQKVGVLAAVLAVLLAVVSIASHRAHTMAVVEKSEANDQWSLYQSKRIKFHSLELGVDLVSLLGHDKPGAPTDCWLAMSPTKRSTRRKARK